MNIELQMMLNEFITRSFTLREMADVLDAVEDVESWRRICDYPSEKATADEILSNEHALEEAITFAIDVLSHHSLDYSLSELINPYKQ